MFWDWPASHHFLVCYISLYSNTGFPTFCCVRVGDLDPFYASRCIGARSRDTYVPIYILMYTTSVPLPRQRLVFVLKRLWIVILKHRDHHHKVKVNNKLHQKQSISPYHYIWHWIVLILSHRDCILQ